MTRLRIINCRALTLDRRRPGPLGIVESAEVAVEGGVITSVVAQGPAAPPPAPRPGETLIDARRRVLMPAFVDAHTHALWAGDRLDEWEMKRRGVPYLDILKSGGGIMSTVRAVRAADESGLLEGLLGRLERMLHEGAATVEVKSGYGLSTQAELKMLRVIARAAELMRPRGMTVVATALLGHALDPDVPVDAFLKDAIHGTLDAVHAEFPGITVDAFCESGAWPLEACAALFERARLLGHPVRVHADQFNRLGMVRWAVERGARSVDHLEASDDETLRLVGASRSFATLLPCSGFHTDGRYARGRTLIDSAPDPAAASDRIVIATNLNPGSAPCGNMPMALALAVRGCGLTPEEALRAGTRNAADLLELGDRGRIVPGARADLVLLRHTDARELAHSFGGDPVDAVIAGGLLTRGDAR